MPLSLASNALTTVATLADELGVDATANNDRLVRVIGAASTAIEQFVQRKFASATYTQRLPYSGTLRLVVPSTPIASVTSIVDDGTTVDPATYRIEDADAGIIVSDTIWYLRDLVVGIAWNMLRGSGEEKLVVTYVGGFTLPKDTGSPTLPTDIEMACLVTATSLYRSRGIDRRIASEGLGDARVQYVTANARTGAGSSGIIPDEAAALLQSYRRITMGD